MKSAFDGDLDADSLVRNLSIRFPRIKFTPGDLLIFLDEIQSCPNARVALKSFSLDGRFDVIASGSLLGIKYKDVTSYPVGYETAIELRSLDFEEFLWALGISDDIISYVSDIVRKKMHMDNSVMEKMNEYYKWYSVVGGMPKVVSKFIETNSFGEVLSEQRDIIAGYMNDIAKYAPESKKTKIWSTFRSIPAQLARENKKFRYNGVEGSRPGDGSRTYNGSLSWLFDAGIVNYCHNLQEPAAPLVSNIIEDAFKVYMNDTGLLISVMEPGVGVSLLSGDIMINKGGIAENMLAEVLAKKGITLTYFEKSGKLETDFILNIDGTVTVLEVKSGNNKRSKSLGIVMSEKYKLKRGIKLENTNVYVDEKGVEHYPLFAASFLFDPCDVKIDGYLSNDHRYQ